MQLIVLFIGVIGAAVIAGVLGHVTQLSNPIWVLPVIVSGFACFLGLLATTSWSMRSRMGLSPAPRITGGIYLAAALLTGGLVAWASETPLLAHVIPLALAGVVAALTVLGRMRRRASTARVDRLQSGAHVVGTVTDDGLAPFAVSPNIKLATVTVSFRDYSGATRWVTAPAIQSPSHLIAVGDQVDVWFDSADPGNISKILVRHDNGASRIAPGQVGTGAKR